MGLNRVWQDSTLCNIHMDTDMDMDMEYGSTWSVETCYIPKYPYVYCKLIMHLFI